MLTNRPSNRQYFLAKLSISILTLTLLTIMALGEGVFTDMISSHTIFLWMYYSNFPVPNVSR